MTLIPEIGRVRDYPAGSISENPDRVMLIPVNRVAEADALGLQRRMIWCDIEGRMVGQVWGFSAAYNGWNEDDVAKARAAGLIA